MTPGAPERLVLAACVVDLLDGVVHRSGETLDLTRTEVDLLAYLAARAGEVVDRDTLLEEVWGHEDAPLTRAVDLAIGRLRRKVEGDPRHPEHLRTVHGEGYCFTWSGAPHGTNLDPERTPFVGRHAERTALRDLLATGARLVTLLGPPGSGKSRLARELGRSSLEEWPGGVWLCALDEARDAPAVRAALATCLGADPAPDRLATALASRGPTLLLLDAFERAAGAAPDTVGAWARAAPEARFVVTSRERLRIQGERVFRVDPLSTSEARALFLRRARAIRPDFASAVEDEAVVAEIVARLEGLPQALELAASSAARLSAHAVRDRLLRAPSSRSVLEESWRLLDDGEREALALCSVFRGGFTLEAAEAMLGGQAIVRLQALQDRSLLAARHAPGGSRRLALYDSVADLARQKLDALGLRERAEAARAAWFLAWGEAAPARAGGALHAEAANGVAAFDHLATHRPAEAARVALVLAGTRSPQAIELLDRALGLVEDPPSRSTLLAARSAAALAAGRPEEALRDAARGLDLAGDAPALHGSALGALSDALAASGRFEEAREAAACALDLAGDDPRAAAPHHHRLAAACERLGDLESARLHVGRALQAFATRDGSPAHMPTLHALAGRIAHRSGDLESARTHREQALALSRSLGEPPLVADHLAALGDLHADRGDLPRAEALHREALGILGTLGRTAAAARSRVALAWLALAAADLPAARRRAEEARDFAHRVSAPRAEAEALAALAVVALADADPQEALSRLQSADRLLEARDTPDLGPLLRAWRGAAERRAGLDAAPSLRSALGSEDPAAKALCDAIEGRSGPDLLHARIARALRGR